MAPIEKQTFSGFLVENRQNLLKANSYALALFEHLVKFFMFPGDGADDTKEYWADEICNSILRGMVGAFSSDAKSSNRNVKYKTSVLDTISLYLFPSNDTTKADKDIDMALGEFSSLEKMMVKIAKDPKYAKSAIDPRSLTDQQKKQIHEKIKKFYRELAEELFQQVYVKKRDHLDRSSVLNLLKSAEIYP